MKIASLVLNKRLFLKESQKEFGKRFGMSHAAISDLETGKTKHISEDMLSFLFEKENVKETDIKEKILNRLWDVLKALPIGQSLTVDRISEGVYQIYNVSEIKFPEEKKD